MSRLQAAGAAALLVLSLGAFAASCVGQPRIAFVIQDAEAPWIMAPLKPTGLLGLAERDALPVTSFRRRFRSAQPAAATLRLEARALRRFDLTLNGEALAPDADPGRHWRAFRRFDLSGRLRAGENELRADVTNATGPPMLALHLEGLAEPLSTGDGWQVSTAGGPWQPAVRVDASHVNPSSYAMPSPAEAVAARGPTQHGLFALSTLLFAVSRHAAGRRLLPGLLLAALAAVWGGLLLRALALPLDAGFDAHHHVKYVDHLRQHRALPLPTDGWMMFHPPVYYGLTALLVELRASPLAWKLPGWLAGIASALACAALARASTGGRRRETGLALFFAALLPMNLYISAYVTNESFHTALACALTWWTVRLLRTARPSPAALLGWAGLVSLAVLTKYTAWIVAAVAGFFLLVRWLRVERVGPGEATRRVALACVTVLVLAGWFYARNLAQFGTPFPLNVDLPGETRQWWAQPGYYTPAFFLRFGDVLRHPFLAGFHSAWDSFYATLWGDGQLGGQVVARFRHAHWDWQLMAATYWLALPATALLALGALRSLRLALFAPDASLRAVHSFLLTLAWALLVSVLYMTLRQQDYGQAKAFYAMAGMAPLSVFFALGAGAADRWLEARSATWARALLYAGLGTLASVAALSFAL